MMYTKPFENVYSHYPLKKGKYQAQKTWTKIFADLPNEDVLIQAIKNQIKEQKFLREQKRFCPPWKHFSTWLNAACFEDECEKPTNQSYVAPKQHNGVDVMVIALGILYDEGESEFKSFCQRNDMSPGDVEAVIFKYNGTYSLEKAEKLAKGIG